MTRYVQTIRNNKGDVFVHVTDNLTIQSNALKIYEFHNDGSLTEYKEPERMFAYKALRLSMSEPAPAGVVEFSSSGLTYYEVMPNGDYRLMSSEECRKMREQLEREEN